MLTNSRATFYALLSCLLLLCAARGAGAQIQNYDISSCGQPTITGTQGTSNSRFNDDAWAFDAVLVITPQYFAPGSASATLTFQISSGPNVQC